MTDSSAARELLQKLGIESTVQHQPPLGAIDLDKKEQLESVKRWYNGDWKNLDKKLQTSIVEGISVFLSLTTILVSNGGSARQPNCTGRAQPQRQAEHPFPRSQPC